jgi:hypothetical protein
MTGASKATATRDLAEMVRRAQLWTTGAGKALRYHINVPGWGRGVASNDSLRGPQASYRGAMGDE